MARRTIIIVFFALFFSVTFLLPFRVLSLETQSWLYAPGRCRADLNWNTTLFSRVGYGKEDNTLFYRSFNVDFFTNLLFSFLFEWEVEGEIEFLRTTAFPFDFQSVAFQARKQVCDDVIGDIVSVVLNGNMRFVNRSRLQDIVTPYHGLWNGEVGCSLGREVSMNEDWWLRVFGYFGFGQADRGYPWIKSDFHIRAKMFFYYELRFFVFSYFGFGHADIIDIKQFHGYRDIQHQNVDVGLSFGIVDVWGELYVTYMHRVFSRNYPTDYNGWGMRYECFFLF